MARTTLQNNSEIKKIYIKSKNWSKNETKPTEHTLKILNTCIYKQWSKCSIWGPRTVPYVVSACCHYNGGPVMKSGPLNLITVPRECKINKDALMLGKK